MKNILFFFQIENDLTILNTEVVAATPDEAVEKLKDSLQNADGTYKAATLQLVKGSPDKRLIKDLIINIKFWNITKHHVKWALDLDTNERIDLETFNGPESGTERDGGIYSSRTEIPLCKENEICCDTTGREDIQLVQNVSVADTGQNGRRVRRTGPRRPAKYRSESGETP